jgi:hypothetical protein
MGNIKHKLNIMSNIALSAVICIVLLTTGLYMWEKGRSVDEYVIYYGNVSTSTSFTTPEDSSFFTFGKWTNKDEGHITFVNSMWCKPIGVDVNPVVIDIRIKEYSSFEFVNQAPEHLAVITNTDTALRAFLSFGVVDMEEIREAAEERDYLSWSMEGIAPMEDSRCYVVADIIVYTSIFHLPKTIHSVSNTFNYFVEGYEAP